MKKTLLAGVSILALSVGAANAADLGAKPLYKAPPPVPVVAPISWTGFYIGGHLGAGWGTNEWDDAASATGCSNSNGQGSANPTCVAIGGGGSGPSSSAGGPFGLESSHTINGFLGGGQIGYNYQFSPYWVLGVEVDGSFADLTGHGSCALEGLLNCNSKVDGLATFKGRVGFTVDHALIFVEGGGAWAHEKFSVTNNNANPLQFVCNVPDVGNTCVIQGGSVSDNRWGWMFGAGIEYLITQNWSAKIEYNFLDLGTKTYVINDSPVFDINSKIHLVKFGVNYHFNWPY